MNNLEVERINSYHEIEKNSIVYFFTKRLIDIVGSSIGLLISLPLVLFVAIIVAIDTPGNPFYSQLRQGKNGRNFKLYKIRSMYCDAEVNGAQWAKENDSRITKIGVFIRKTRIDELPQLLNILIGDMTLVGPRPERREFTLEFSKELPNFPDRLLVKPGLTGWAQVNGGYELSPSEKLKYDLYYIANQTLLFDIKILLYTVKVVFTGEGAR